MVNDYQSNYSGINLDNIGEILKKFVECIHKFNSISAANECIIDDDKKFEIYTLADCIADLLKEDDFFYDEYFDFCEIKDMIEYTLNRNVIKESDLMFIFVLLLNFSKLIHYKQNLDENDDFKSAYNSFLTEFNEFQTYFYENICDENMDDELFIEYANLIVE